MSDNEHDPKRDQDHGDLAEAQDAKRADARVDGTNLSKAVLLGTICHEIRTPLNSILLIADALKATRLSAQQAEMLDDMLSAGDQLQELLAGFIDLADIESGEISMEFQTFSPHELAAEVVASFESAARGKGLTLDFQTTAGSVPIVHGAAKRVRQVLVNLVTNAVKFTTTGGISILCDAARMDDSDDVRLSLRVSDTGAGVPDAIKHTIFDRFYRSDTNIGHEIPGVRISLSIAKTICTLHGGGLSVADGLNGGAVFTANFHTRPAEASDDGAADNEDITTTILRPGLRMVVAEDVFLNRRSLKHLLKPFGVQLIFATNGIEALELLKTTDFDIGLIDLRMPGTGGLETIRLYRDFEGSQGTPRRPLIACSAHVSSGEEEQCLAGGFDAFLSKPIRQNSLIELINSLC